MKHRNKYNTVAYINLNALKHNIRTIQKMAPKSKILAMVKSNAYGHGATIVAKTIEKNVGAFGVACLEEALALSHAKIKKQILLMKGFNDANELKIIDKHKFSVVIHNVEQLKILEKAQLNNKLAIWFKINTGMNRLGFSENDVLMAYENLVKNSYIKKPFCLMTHLSDADYPRKAKNKEQICCFEKITKGMSGLKCIANSGTILHYKSAHKDWIRPGIILYGVSPYNEKTGKNHGLKPVMTLKSRIVAIQNLKKGATIGYGSTWTCPQDMRVAIVSAGYGDGYPRNAKNGTPVLVDNKLCSLVGRVSMDMLNIDLRNAPNAKVGDEVIFWGENLPIEKVAPYLDTIPYELFCQLTQRVKFCYV